MSPEILFKNNINLAYSLATKYYNRARERNIPQEDIKQISLLSLWKECLRYKNKKYAFSTIVFKNCARDLQRYINSKENFLVPVIIKNQDNLNKRYVNEACQLSSEKQYNLESVNFYQRSTAESILLLKECSYFIDNNIHRNLMYSYLAGNSYAFIGKQFKISPQTALNRVQKVKEDLCSYVG